LELSNLPVALISPSASGANNDHPPAEPLEISDETRPLTLSLLDACPSSGSPGLFVYDPLDATMHSHRFPSGHRLNERFVLSYVLREEIGSGGYGFVMVASRRGSPGDVAVKFIIRKKVPAHAWVQDSKLGRLPTEIWLLSRIRHPNIADFLEYFEDNVYYYLVRMMIRITLAATQSPWKGPRAPWFPLGL
jgi:serine/threonine protein kinase